MIPVLIVSHGGLAAELLHTARTIVGEMEGFHALCLDWSRGLEEAREEIAERLHDLEAGKGVLVLTVMFGDTPANAALCHATPGKVEVVTGVNLPMVVRLGCMAGTDMALTQMAQWIAGKGRGSIHYVPPSRATQKCAEDS